MENQPNIADILCCQCTRTNSHDLLHILTDIFYTFLVEIAFSELNSELEKCQKERLNPRDYRGQNIHLKMITVIIRLLDNNRRKENTQIMMRTMMKVALMRVLVLLRNLLPAMSVKKKFPRIVLVFAVIFASNGTVFHVRS